MGTLYKTYHLANALVEFFDNEIIYDVEDTKDCHTNIHFDAHLDDSNTIIVDVLENTEHFPSQITDSDNIFNNRFKLTIECIPKTEYKIDNKPNPPMPKDYDKFTFDPQLAEEYARKAADISGMSLEEFVKTNNKPAEVIDRPKHIIVNGALYEKIDVSVLTIVNGYGDMV